MTRTVLALLVAITPAAPAHAEVAGGLLGGGEKAAVPGAQTLEITGFTGRIDWKYGDTLSVRRVDGDDVETLPAAMTGVRVRGAAPDALPTTRCLVINDQVLIGTGVKGARSGRSDR